MAKALVKILEGVVENDNLLKDDEFIIHGVTSTDSFRLISRKEGGKAIIMGDGYFNIDGVQTKEYDTNTGETATIVCNEPVDIKVNKKWDVYFVNIPHFYMEDWEYVTKLETIQASTYSGNVESLEHSKLYRCAISGSGVYGDLSKLPSGILNLWFRYTAVTTSDLAKLVASTKDSADSSILLTGSQAVTGTIESIVAACVEVGRTNRNQVLSIRDTQVTFGGSNAIAKAAEFGDSRLKWTDKEHITFQCGSDANVADSTKAVEIWAKGASSEQIATWESQGNIVHIVA